jgi:hypothetical protein
MALFEIHQVGVVESICARRGKSKEGESPLVSVCSRERRKEKRREKKMMCCMYVKYYCYISIVVLVVGG